MSDDGAYTGSTTKLNGYWSSTDPDSVVVEYQYAVGTTAGGTDIVGWTSAGTAVEAAIDIPSPGMSEGPTYYITVKAKSEAGDWSEPGTSNGIRVAPALETIADAKALADAQPVALRNKVVTADLGGACYIQETDWSSGILVMGSGAAPGTLITVGGTMGLNEHNERAITGAAVVAEAAADPLRIPATLMISGKNLGGENFNAFTFGVAGGIGLNNVGLLVRMTGMVTSVGEGEMWLSDGSTEQPVKVAAYMTDLSGLQVGDLVIVTGISTLELDGTTLSPALKVTSPSGILKLN